MLIVQRPQIEEEQLAEHRSRFVVEPLEPGFGYTLGNTLRRTLLSRIPGAAITSVRIEGVQHEFSTIGGVVEDVVDIICVAEKADYGGVEKVAEKTGYRVKSLLKISTTGEKSKVIQTL